MGATVTNQPKPVGHLSRRCATHQPKPFSDAFSGLEHREKWAGQDSNLGPWGYEPEKGPFGNDR
jgi:hypothetical protein